MHSKGAVRILWRLDMSASKPRRGRPAKPLPVAQPKPKDAYTVRRLLYSRGQVAHALGGVSISTVIRLEREGVLTPIKLLPKRTSAQTFYRVDEVEALASGAEGLAR
jgi:hypothetical protein